MLELARTRAEVDIRSSPKAGAGIIDRLPADCAVDILDDLNRWYRVKPDRILNCIPGYLPQMALTFPDRNNQRVFPDLPPISGSIRSTSVPPSLKLADFMSWLDGGGKPVWIKDESWAKLGQALQADLIEKICLASKNVRPRWDDWLGGIKTNNRLDAATMNEWIVIMEGGREVYAIRDHYVYMNPVQNSSYYGYVAKGQILRWTGHVRSDTRDGKTRDFYEVDFFRMSRYMHGWFRADITADYIFPLPGIDPDIESNAQSVFDLTKPALRLPTDHAMDEARQKGYYASQYIDVFDATKHHLVHFSLCGEFCVAALGGEDVLPMLKKWLDSKYWRAAAILGNPHEGTSAGDLQDLLSVSGMVSQIYKSMPVTTQGIKDHLLAGQLMIAGCGINSIGRLKANGKIRHWVVVEDVIPSGNSGWIRVYNPFQNKEEVYNFDVFQASAGSGTGLWILPEGQAKPAPAG